MRALRILLAVIMIVVGMIGLITGAVSAVVKTPFMLVLFKIVYAIVILSAIVLVPLAVLLQLKEEARMEREWRKKVIDIIRREEYDETLQDARALVYGWKFIREHGPTFTVDEFDKYLKENGYKGNAVRYLELLEKDGIVEKENEVTWRLKIN